jgi:putative membrane protein
MRARTLVECFMVVSLVVSGARAVAADAPPPKASPAFGNPGFANPDTPGLLVGAPAADAANTVDVIFMQQMAMGGRAEVDLGNLAVDRSDVAGIDGFGKQMVRDHGAANKELTSVARTAEIELPQTLDAEHTAALAELSKLRGADFDRRYAESQVKDHQKAVQLLIHEIGSGQHSAVRDFATRTLPSVTQHLEHARELHMRVAQTGTSTSPPEPPGTEGR